MKLPTIAITMGDPAGIGPELCLRLLADDEVNKFCEPIVFGDVDILNLVNKKLDLGHKTLTPESASVFHVPELDASKLVPGKIDAQTGSSSFKFINAAIDEALEGVIDAIATGPINKEAWQQAGIKYPGHTELFAERGKTDRFCMMMTAPSFSCSLVTTHVGYDEVTSLLTTDRILEVTQLTHDSLFRIYDRKPKLVMLGLNPHAGEGGLFGNQEEENLIQPAVEKARQLGVDISDPIPPDTAFLPWRRKETDGYICMYHDQGLIPFKALNFDTGVNVTLGLPSLVRTSVDHGTALDIAWQGKADVSSLIAAVKLAAKLA